MGWNERGKFGIHSGKTLRRHVGENSSRKQPQNLLLKTTRTSRDISKEDLLSSWDIDDGLPDEEVKSFRVGRYPRRTEDIIYSLDKRKRWEKIREIKDWITSEKEDQELPKVVLVERLVNLAGWFAGSCTKGDCLGVYDSESGESKPRRKTAHVGDLLQKDPSEQIIYEASLASVFQSYPIYPKSYNYNVYPGKKAVVKSKGQKSNRLYGVETKQSLNQAASNFEGCGSLIYWGRNGKIMYKRISDKRKNSQESNVSLVDDKSFKKMLTCSKPYSKPSFQVNLEELVKQPKQKHAKRKLKIKSSKSEGRQSKPYSKKNVIYVDSVENDLEVGNSEHPPGEIIKPSASWTKIDEPVQLEVEQASVQPKTLWETFGDSYKESTTSERKFVVRFETHDTFLPGQKNLSGHAYLLCEEQSTNVKSSKAVLRARVVLTGSLYSCGLSEAIFQKLQSFVAQSKVLTINQVFCGLLEDLKMHLSKQGNHPNSNKMPNLKPRLSWHHDLMASCTEVVSEEEAMQMIEKEIVQDCKKKSLTKGAREGETNLDSQIECGICWRDLNSSGNECEPSSRLQTCNHVFCLTCWAQYLTTSISQGNTTIHCPAYQCQQVVDDVFIMSLLPAFVINEYVNLKKRTTFEKDKKFKWCPANDCNAVAIATSTSYCSVNCTCGTSWCYDCQESIHWPATCKQYSEFLENSSEYKNFLKDQIVDFYVQVKKCPDCNYPIEKNGGCPHMRCTMCNTSYCWDCLTPFKEMSDYIHTCRKQGTEEVNLTTNLHTPKSRIFCKEVFENLLARKSLHSTNVLSLIHQYESLQKFYFDCGEYGRQIPCTKSLKSVTMKMVLESFSTGGFTPLLRKAFTFCEQAYFVLEHLAISLSMTNPKHRSQNVMVLYKNLKFIVDRVQALFSQGIVKIADKQTQNHLSLLLTKGQRCQESIKLFARKMK